MPKLDGQIKKQRRYRGIKYLSFFLYLFISLSYYLFLSNMFQGVESAETRRTNKDIEALLSCIVYIYLWVSVSVYFLYICLSFCLSLCLSLWLSLYLSHTVCVPLPYTRLWSYIFSFIGSDQCCTSKNSCLILYLLYKMGKAFLDI